MMSLQNSGPLLFLPSLSSFFEKWIKRGSPPKGESFKVLFSNSLLPRQNLTTIEINRKMEITEHNRAGIFVMYTMKSREVDYSSKHLCQNVTISKLIF